MPVLPPTLESTWASRVVGICTKGRPRKVAAAAKPARSPTTPPPSAMTAVRRSTPRASRWSTSSAQPSTDFEASPGSISTVPTVKPALSRPCHELGQMERGDGPVGHDDGAALGQDGREQAAGAGEQARCR